MYSAPSIVVAMVALPVLFLSACSSPKPLYEAETFSQTDTFSRTIDATASQACDAGRRALLSQGYVITRAKDNILTATKSFQPRDDHYEIQFNLVCNGAGNAATQSTIFANAVQDRYTLKKTNNSASVGLSVLGSVSMPFGSTDDSLVKVGSETITASKFYDGFFNLLKTFIDRDPSHTLPALSPQQEKAAAAAAAAAKTNAAHVPAPAGVPVPESGTDSKSASDNTGSADKDVAPVP